MNKNLSTHILRNFIAGILLYFAMMTLSVADVYINVMAVNGTDVAKTSPIKFNLPGELTAEDILDTNGLQLDYSVDDANYFVYGDVTLNPKESKTFRIHVKDKWQVTPDQVAQLKKQIEEGFTTIGQVHDAQKADILKDRLDKKIDYIVNLQSTNVDSIDKRIDAYRTYAKELKRVQNDALNVDYWRSDPDADQAPKLIHMIIEIDNPSKSTKHFKHKNYLPEEIKPEDVLESEDFEVRFDQIKQLSFLFKEEDLTGGQKKKYTIGIRDIWTIDQKDIDYLRSRAKYAFDFLKGSKYEDSAKVLIDRITVNLSSIEASQTVQRAILEHISTYRANRSAYGDAQKDVETLEKLVALLREDLEKSKVQNILQKIQALKGVSDVSKVMFNKKFEATTAWSYIGWILFFVGLLTLTGFVVSLLRAKDKEIKEEQAKKKT